MSAFSIRRYCGNVRIREANDFLSDLEHARCNVQDLLLKIGRDGESGVAKVGAAGR